MTLNEADTGTEYIIKDVLTEDEEMDAFLFSLGCYKGEYITVVSRRKGGCYGLYRERKRCRHTGGLLCGTSEPD